MYLIVIIEQIFNVDVIIIKNYRQQKRELYLHLNIIFVNSLDYFIYSSIDGFFVLFCFVFLFCIVEMEVNREKKRERYIYTKEKKTKNQLEAVRKWRHLKGRAAKSDDFEDKRDLAADR